MDLVATVNYNQLCSFPRHYETFQSIYFSISIFWTQLLLSSTSLSWQLFLDVRRHSSTKQADRVSDIR